MLGAGDERPPLPALACVGNRDAEALWREARALARPGDLLLCLDSGDGACLAGALQLSQGAQLRAAAVVHGAIAQPAPDTDGIDFLVLPTAPRHQLLTLQAMTLGCLCHLIEINLFGH
jgi:D-sedoheptulose 7-phosphate isomerase